MAGTVGPVSKPGHHVGTPSRAAVKSLEGPPDELPPQVRASLKRCVCSKPPEHQDRGLQRLLQPALGFTQGLKMIQSPVTVLINKGESLKSEGKEVTLPPEKPDPMNSAPEATTGPWPSWQGAGATALKDLLPPAADEPGLRWELKALASQVLPTLQEKQLPHSTVANSSTTTWIQS